MSIWVRLMLVIMSGEVMSDSSTSTLGVAYLSPLGPYPWLLALIADGPTNPTTGEPERLRLSQALLLSLIPYAIAGIHMWGLLGFGWQLYSTVVIYLPVAGILVVLLSWPFVRLHHSPYLRIIGMTLAWVVASTTRTLPADYSFPTLAGPPMADAAPFNQLAAVAGPWGMEAFIALVSMLLAQATVVWLRRADSAGQRGTRWWVGLALAVVAVVGIGGGVRLAMAPTMVATWDETESPLPEGDILRVALVQGSTPNWMHRRGWSFERLQEAIDENTMILVRRALAKEMWGEEPDWVVLPESALGRSLPADPKKALAELRRTVATPHWAEKSTLFLVMTAMMDRPSPDHPRADRKDTVYVLEPEGGQVNIVDQWSKRQLVPIGERRYHPGDPWRPLENQHMSAGGIICFESLYPQISDSLVRQGAEALIVFTNDAGQRWSDAAVWHARLGKVRAIESGMTMVHASQAGPSFVMDPYGRTSATLGLFERGVVRAAFSKQRVWTLYGVLGSMGWIALFAMGWLVALVWRLRTVRS